MNHIHILKKLTTATETLGYDSANVIREEEYGQPTDIVNTYMKNIMELPVITGANPRKVKEF